MSIIESTAFEKFPIHVTIDDIVAFASNNGHELPDEEIRFALSEEHLNESDFVVQALAYETDDKSIKRRVLSMAIEITRILPIIETAKIREQLEADFQL